MWPLLLQRVICNWDKEELHIGLKHVYAQKGAGDIGA